MADALLVAFPTLFLEDPDLRPAQMLQNFHRNRIRHRRSAYLHLPVLLQKEDLRKGKLAPFRMG